MAQNYFFPPAGGGSSNASVGTNGITAPTSSTEVAGINPSGNLQPLQTDASGNLKVALTSDIAELNVNLNEVGGAAIALGQTVMASSLPVAFASNQSALPLSTGASTSALQTQISGQLPTTLGAHVTAASLAVNIASDQTVPVSIASPVADVVVTGTITSTQSVVIPTASYGTVTFMTTGTWAGTLVVEASVDGINYVSYPATQIVSGLVFTTFAANLTAQIDGASFADVRIRGNTVTSGTATVYMRVSNLSSLVTLDSPLPQGGNNIGSINNITGTVSLPTGAATSANQTTMITDLAQIATNTAGIAQGSSIVGEYGYLQLGSVSTSAPTFTTGLVEPLSLNTSGGLRVDGSGVTQPVSAAALPLPTGAATSALQTTISGQLPTTLGQKVSASSLAVVLASDQSSVSTSVGGKSRSNLPVYNIYGSTPVTTSAYVQLVASTSSVTNMIEIFDSSGQSMIIGVGASGSEVVQLYTLPGGNGQVPLAIPAGSRVAIKALTASATSGYLTINFYS